MHTRQCDFLSRSVAERVVEHQLDLLDAEELNDDREQRKAKLVERPSRPREESVVACVVFGGRRPRRPQKIGDAMAPQRVDRPRNQHDEVDE